MTSSQECGRLLSELKDLGSATAYVILATRPGLPAVAPMRGLFEGVQGDVIEFGDGHVTVRLDLSDDAIQTYLPVIQEVASFGAAVRALSIYERYIDWVIRTGGGCMSERFAPFRMSHHLRRRRRAWKVDHYLAPERGRGIDLLTECFDWQPSPDIRPSMLLLFQLRNTSVHNANRADRHLCRLADNEYSRGPNKPETPGQLIKWDPALFFQAQCLVARAISSADEAVRSVLETDETDVDPWWQIGPP